MSANKSTGKHSKKSNAEGRRTFPSRKPRTRSKDAGNPATTR